MLPMLIFMFFGGLLIACIALSIILVILRICLFRYPGAKRFLNKSIIIFAGFPLFVFVGAGAIDFGQKIYYSGEYSIIQKDPIIKLKLSWNGKFKLSANDCNFKEMNGEWEISHGDNDLILDLKNYSNDNIPIHHGIVKGDTLFFGNASTFGLCNFNETALIKY